MMEPQTTPNVASIAETAFTWPKVFTVMGCMPDSRLKNQIWAGCFPKYQPVPRVFIRPTSSVRRQLP